MILVRQKDFLRRNNIGATLLIIASLLFIFRTAIPFFKYPFFIFYLIIIIVFPLKYWSGSKIKIIKLSRNYISVILLIFFLMLSFLFSNKLHLVICKDICNTLVVLSFFYFTSLIISAKEQLLIFIDYLILIVIFFAAVISLYGLLGFFSEDGIITHIDYNFALLPIFFGFIGILYKVRRGSSLLNSLLYYFLLLLFTFNILISGSRRGLVILTLIVIAFIGIQIFTLFKKNNFLSKLRNISRLYLYCLSLFLIFSYLFFFQTSYNFKTNSLKVLGIQDVYKAKQRIATSVFSYYSILNPNITFSKLMDLIWTHSFYPKDPDSGWGTRVHKTMYPLEGKGSDLIPQNTKGYLMDSSCNASTWRNNAYSFTKFINVKVIDNTQIKASVYCYVSPDFDGTWVKLSSEGSSFGDVVCTYNMEKKGEWQKLTIQPDCKKGNVPIYLYFSKYEVTDFNSLNGYVIFAYPAYEIIRIKDTISSDSLNANLFNTFTFHGIIDEKLVLKDRIPTTNIYKASIFSGILASKFLGFIQSIKDPDPFRNWVKNIFNEDTTYYGLKTEIDLNINVKNAIHGRTDRWKFAWLIFKKEYNWKQKFFGNGFDYLNWYGYYFYKDKTKTDWPHNPFLSVLLYSGIIGLSLYLLLLYKVIAIYLKYIKEYYMLFIFWGITFFFSFFSANSPFNPPVMGFFMMLPFFIDYIHKKDKSN